MLKSMYVNMCSSTLQGDATYGMLSVLGKKKIAGKLRNPYFHNICQIGRQKKSSNKGTHWLGQGFKIGLNENGTNF